MSVAIKVARSGSQGGVPIGRNVSSGDPGLFGSIFGGVKKLAGAAITTLTRGPVAGAGSLFTAGPALPRGVPAPGFLGTAQRVVPGGETGVGTGCAKGHSPNKSDYFLRDGSFVPKGTRCVKNRRRNPANARATSRAISRINGAKRMQHVLAQIETKTFSKAGNKKSCN